ncbi:methyltransferase type 11 [Natronococcus amylolyticus DSM 10524]|uniref:Methyltransferase type 11 n=2 Tax=Natronococcus amylolyticus TaxID=44470 RepID=L9XEM6_9EURY|nr:methyltransferase type 11 [Natronococcus amylolyticus DSM 10524]
MGPAPDGIGLLECPEHWTEARQPMTERTDHADKRAIADNYGRPDLERTILDAYEDAGTDTARLTRDDTAALDEFHIQGRDATRALADLADLDPGDRVLDVGSGIGGPARTLAAEFDCHVTGIDLVEEYCRVAETLTERLGLEGRVSVRRVNAVDLPFDDNAFDAVWLQHVSMNVAEKGRLADELHRVLRPGGQLALHEVCAGPGGDPYFPVPWADDSSISHLATAKELSRLLAETGFEELEWIDATDDSLEWFRSKLEAMAARPADAPPPLGLNLLMGPETPTKMKNVVRNLEDERIAVVQGVVKKPDQ